MEKTVAIQDILIQAGFAEHRKEADSLIRNKEVRVHYARVTESMVGIVLDDIKDNAMIPVKVIECDETEKAELLSKETLENMTNYAVYVRTEAEKEQFFNAMESLGRNINRSKQTGAVPHCMELNKGLKVWNLIDYVGTTTYILEVDQAIEKMQEQYPDEATEETKIYREMMAIEAKVIDDMPYDEKVTAIREQADNIYNENMLHPVMQAYIEGRFGDQADYVLEERAKTIIHNTIRIKDDLAANG